MPTKYIDSYEIEFSAEPLEGCSQWGAYIAVFAPSSNPMHRINVLHKQRVAAEQQLADEAAAHAAAEAAAPEIVEQIKSGKARRS
jgi:enhancing lycopene biosynthesis protein 2